MSDTLELLSPEVEALLRELAQDPESTLLRVDRPRELRDLSMRRAEVSARSAGWTNAERKLLECHREEVAFLLRYLYYVRFVSSERQIALRELRLRQNFRGLRPDEDLLRSRIARHAAQLRREHAADPTTALVEESLDLSRDPAVAPMQLAAVSLRLVPSESARLYMGYEYSAAGHARSALRVAQAVIERGERSSVQAHALGLIGRIYTKLGCTPLSLAAYKSAHHLDPTLPTTALEALGQSVQVGDQAGASRIARGLDLRFLEHYAGMERWATLLRLARKRGEWAPSSDSRSAVRDVLRTCGPSVAVVLEVFCE
ncbi:MAG: hypothetical protein H6828_14295 [Planctomycetes bacterium]|nr:hypothetical protein [Planctomycetota bacterium]